MTRWLRLLPLRLLMFLVAMLVAPILPLFASPQWGMTDNATAVACEPRLPAWLSWFQTPDNSLWGDHGWKTVGCPNYQSWVGMVRWLWRNPLYGFSWTVLGWPIAESEQFAFIDSGNGLDVDKGRDRAGWFLIRSSSGAFQFRWVRVIFGLQLALDIGWLLDPYVQDPTTRIAKPLALYQLSPNISRA